MNAEYYELFKAIFKKFCDKEGLKDGIELGKGGFGIVKEVSHGSNKFAGKVFKKEEKSIEITSIMGLKHNNIIETNYIFEETFCVFDDENKEKERKAYNFILMEKANTCLYKFVKSRPLDYINIIPNLSEDFIRYLLKQILKAMELLFKYDLIHFDIKPPNILLGDYLTPKVTDFSLVISPKVYENNELEVFNRGGTLGYQSPESYFTRYFSLNDGKKQDYFALGAVLYYLKTGQQLFSFNENEVKIFKEKYEQRKEEIEKIFKEKYEQRTKEIEGKKWSQNFKNLLLGLINYNVGDRYDFIETYASPFVNEKYFEHMVLKMINNDKEDMKLLYELEKLPFYPEKNRRKKFKRYRNVA